MPDSPRNRLAQCTSPYLLQHAGNPVDWYPWGPEAFAAARTQHKPIFLSIGYAACHWCHVMERESFENPEIAALLNEHFISIKVDREERPDVDEVYMLATQIMTGSGGWPMSVFLTPELEPFYAGTYFPPDDRFGRPGFPRLVTALADAWQTRQAELRAQAAKVVAAVQQFTNEAAATGENARIDLPTALHLAIEQFADRFDDEHGGLGPAPKFPPHQALGLFLEMLRAPEGLVSPQDLSLARTMLTATLDHMARGGIYDQIAGGFARYATDPYWLVPHFEKMLYDNAQLAIVYAQAAAQLSRPDYARIARGTLDFFLREMTSPSGGFFSSLDADSEGVEGKFYVWTVPEIRAALPEASDADLIVHHFGITEAGNWPEGGAGTNILHVATPVEDLALQYNATPEALQKRIDALCMQLRQARARRVPPGRDDKILTSWNGLMISALAAAGRSLGEPRYLEAAHRAIGYMLIHHMEAGRQLLRTAPPPDTIRNQKSAIQNPIPGFLEDHAYLLNGLMDLIASTTPTSLPGTMSRKRALELADTMIRQFEDSPQGGFLFTAAVHEPLFARVKNATDGAVPSANGVAIRALLRLAQVSGKEEYRAVALRAARAFAEPMGRQPSYLPTILHALAEDQRHEYQRIPVGAPDAIAATAPAATPPVSPATSPAAALRLESPAIPPVQPGQTFDLSLIVHIAPGYHIQLHEPADREAFATVARARGEPLTAQTWDYPPGEPVASDLLGYHGQVRFVGHCTVSPKAKPGTYTLRATVLAQPCTATACLPPERATLEVSLQIG